jgi:hypothetical protein
MRVAIALTGALSLFLGYRLFCDQRTARGALLTNLLSGALLAIFGLGILIADFRGVPRIPVRDIHPAWQKKSLVTPKTSRDKNFPERFA